jgi:hypothetical protein
VYRAFGATVLVALLTFSGSPRVLAQAGSAPAPAKSASDLDAFMQQVLARRDANRTLFNQYVLDETESFELLGPARNPLHRRTREFTWYARDGMHVRSPVRFDGVAIGETARRQYEDDWITREQGRQARRERHEPEKNELTIGADGLQVSGGGIGGAEPRFVSEAYFMDFKFEPGNYYLAGREKLEGHDVLRIEYYPTHLFNDTDDEKTPREIKKNREDRAEQEIDRKMNKTALVTLWVDPAEHQVVKYTFDNVWLDFLPVAWLVRIDDLRASMTMGQPFAGVWLPRTINIHGGFTLATGSFEASYERAFTKYREADVKTTIKVPKLESRAPECDGGPVPGRACGFRLQAEVESAKASNMPGAPGVLLASWSDADPGVPEHGPLVDQEPAVETIREIRVHGNASLTDEAVLKLAGVTVGDPVTPSVEKDIEQRLKATRRFVSVEVRKRYRSLDDPTDVAIVLVVHERPGTATTASGADPPTAWRRLTSRLMFLPILGYADGYGLTYGGRVSTFNLMGAGERLSVPLTWGATKRAALELERTFKSGPLTRVLTSVGIWNRENPFYDIDDQRVEWTGRAERLFAGRLRTGIEASRASVSFAPLDDDLWTVGADVTLDTRRDPAFPANAVLIGGGWSALHVSGAEPIHRYNTDARGYLRVFRQNVIAGRVQYFDADAALPPYERLLLGGASNLRGFRAGSFAADRMVITSAEWRATITPVIHGAKFGILAFVDAARAADYGTSLGDVDWQRGAGAGLFVIAPLVHLNLNVAHGVHTRTRVNVGTGFSF